MKTKYIVTWYQPNGGSAYSRLEYFTDYQHAEAFAKSQIRVGATVYLSEIVEEYTAQPVVTLTKHRKDG